MQRLMQPRNLVAALVASALTTAASLPRLARWDERPQTLPLLALVLGLSAFLLWGFVFAWSPKPRGAWLALPRDAQGWGLAALAGLGGAVLLSVSVDPTLRTLTPTDYPDSLAGWLAGTLFTLAFLQLFLCFAPYAFFFRLLHHPTAAAIATVGFSLFLLALQLNALPVSITPGFTTALVAIRLLFASVSLYLLNRGGPWFVWLAILIAQGRLLPEALSPHTSP